MTLSGWISASNDALSQGLMGHFSTSFSWQQVVFFRFLFATLWFLLWRLWKGSESFSTTHHRAHQIRGALLSVGMMLFTAGMRSVALPLVTSIGFITPFFTLLLAHFFLKERMTWSIFLATLVGFGGVVISVWPQNNGSVWTHIPYLLLLATLSFGALDTLNKALVNLKEGLVPMMFYSTFWTACFCLPGALWSWQQPQWIDLLFFAALGLGSNAVIYCIVKAFSRCKLSILQPFRYLELLFSCILSALFFQQSLSLSFFLGTLLIIPAGLYVTLVSQNKRS